MIEDVLRGDYAMMKWAYRIVDSKDVAGKGIFGEKSRAALEDHLNRLGTDGWEIVNIDWVEFEGRASFVGIAKRPA